MKPTGDAKTLVAGSKRSSASILLFSTTENILGCRTVVVKDEVDRRLFFPFKVDSVSGDIEISRVTVLPRLKLLGHPNKSVLIQLELIQKPHIISQVMLESLCVFS